VRLPQGGGDFSLPRIVQTDTGAYPAFYTMGFEELKRPEHEADHLHLVAILRVCGGRGVDEVHSVLTGGGGGGPQKYKKTNFIFGFLGLYLVRL
jgi:hypothetical protein